MTRASGFNTYAVVSAYQTVASEVLPRFYRRDRCVNATAVCLQVMAEFGVEKVYAVSVEAEMMNAAYYELESAGELTVEKGRERNAWKVILSKEPGTPGWIGHVVVVVRDLLIDSAASQMHRPEKKMVVPEVLVLPVQPAFALGKWMHFRSTDGAVVRYRAHHEDQGFLNLPGFRNPANATVAKKITKDMTRLLQNSGHR